VDSGVIRLIRKKDFSLSVDEKLFLKEDAIFAMRPEQLSVSEFIKLTQKIATDVIWNH